MAAKVLKGYNNRYLVNLVEDEEKEESLLLIPEDFSEQSQHTVCQFVGERPDKCGTATHCLAESHLLETVKIDSETHTFVSEHAILCIWEE